MDVETISKYAILTQYTRIRLHQSPDIVIKGDRSNDALDAECFNEAITISTGALVKIFEEKLCASKSLITIQVLDFINSVPMYENLYECPRSNLRLVEENVWPFIICIEDPKQRLRMVQDANHCNWLLNLKLNDIVSLSGLMFNKSNIHYNCIIRYIGPVVNLYSVGYFFGLEILDLSNGHSPQADKIPFAFDLIKCDPKLAIFATANWISQIPNEQQKIFSGRSFINGTIEKVKSAIAPSSYTMGSNAFTNSSRKTHKNSKTPTAQFYDNVSDTTDGCINNNNNNNKKMERGKKVLPNVFLGDSEEFKQSIENREKSLERRATNTAQTQTQPQSGILKNKHKDMTKSQTKFTENGPEIFVIDKDDIHESTRQESEVIVVDKQSKNVELVQLLGQHWPKAAGGTADILNNHTLQPVITSDGNTTLNSTKSSNRGVRNKSTNSLTGTNPKKTNDTVSSINKNSESKNVQKSGRKKSKNNNYNRINNEPMQCANASSNEIDIDATGVLPTVLDNKFMTATSLQEVPNTGLGLGSLVEVNVIQSSEHLYGVINWIGIPPGMEDILVGVELEEDCIDKNLVTTDGCYNGVSLFKCPVGRGIFVAADQCSIDRRFLGAEGGAIGNGVCESSDKKLPTENGFHDNQQTFGHMECPIVQGAVAPIKCSSLNSLEELCGKFKGIQGHHNSCYLDVTLFSMFAFTPVFDTILYRPAEKDDIPHYTEVQTVLREEIVNPLRKHKFVRADRVMKLRQLLDKLSSVSGLTSEEKDPEEFLNCLLSQIMRAEPFIKFNSGHDSYFYQLFVEKDERLSFPSVQQLFEQSFYVSDIKLKEVPSCLIIQMPRFGKSFKMYPRILPSQVLDVTNIIDDSPRQCAVCGILAEFECRDCFGGLQNGMGFECTSLCAICLQTVHKHAKRINHKYRKLSVPEDFRVMQHNMMVPRLYMELFAVVCIETSHYVTFVKAGSGPDAPWCFFDSMADRKGEQNGYNIPEMITVPDLPQWLSDDGARTVNETSSNDKMLPEHAKRLFCDAYLCMYQSTDVMMYR